MRFIINYLRQCFCKHQWKLEEKYISVRDLSGDKNSEKVSATCEKCCYHKSYWKFL